MHSLAIAAFAGLWLATLALGIVLWLSGAWGLLNH